MTENVTSEEVKDLPNMKLIGLIKLARPQFLIAYLIIALGALAQGIRQDFAIDIFHALFGILLVLVSAIGVHYRDEAGDWASGYDLEIGGMGVIRDGIMTEESVRLIGRIISAVTILLGILQAQLLLVNNNSLGLFLIGVPIFFMIVFVNFFASYLESRLF